MTNQPVHPSVSIPASEGAEPVWLGRPSSGDGTCRGGYAIPVVERLGTRCAYCDRDLFASYEDWLNLSVDHVVPRNAAAAGIPVEWIEDLLNHVPCCRACNEFLARYQVTVRAPDDIAGFVALRDSTLTAKRIHALGRHRIEHERFDAWQRKRQSGEAGK